MADAQMSIIMKDDNRNEFKSKLANGLTEILLYK